ncbi:MAG: hypothetical protein NTV97_17095, partial [Alphaproteobacteria bacterium]|nr:hypothetical protein [Alphaproteobacteria bacterium]
MAVIPKGPNSTAKERITENAACLDAIYESHPGSGEALLADEPIFMILPNCCLRISSSSKCVPVIIASLSNTTFWPKPSGSIARANSLLGSVARQLTNPSGLTPLLASSAIFFKNFDFDR